MKKKVIIYIDGDEYIRNYFTYNSLDLKGYDVVIYANKDICNKHILLFNNKFKAFIAELAFRRKIRFWQCDFVMAKFIKKSKTFAFRLNRYSRYRRIRIKLLNLPIISFFSELLFKWYLKDNLNIKAILENERPDLVIIPTQVATPICLDFIELCNKMSIKTLCLIDGWDNISSKTIFPVFPSYMAVWGEQSVEHAFNIQGFPRERIYKIGTPRFESYESNQETVENNGYNFKYVLFTGCSLAFDEISVLKLLDYTLVKNNITDIKIIYRPHPWRQKRNCFDYFIPEDFQNVILDKQMLNYYLCSKTAYMGNGIQPALKYYPRLLNECLFTISPLTTMIIEAAIVGKYVMALAYDDGFHYTNPKNALNNYEHFKGIEEISAFKFCYNFEDIPKIFLDLLKSAGSRVKKNDFREEIKYIIEQTDKKYSNRLNIIVDEILNQ